MNAETIFSRSRPSPVLLKSGLFASGMPEKQKDMPPIPPIPKKPQIDEETLVLLKEYLQSDRVTAREAKEDKILDMLERSHNWQLEHHAIDQKNFGDIKGELKEISLRLSVVEDDVTKLQKNAEDTGRHNLTKLEQELERRRQRDEKRRELQEARRYDAKEWVRRNWLATLISVISVAVAVWAVLHSK